MSGAPRRSSNCGAMTLALGWTSAQRTNAAMAPASHTQSGLSSSTNSVCAARQPWLWAAPKTQVVGQRQHPGLRQMLRRHCQRVVVAAVIDQSDPGHAGQAAAQGGQAMGAVVADHQHRHALGKVWRGQRGWRGGQGRGLGGLGGCIGIAHGAGRWSFKPGVGWGTLGCASIIRALAPPSPYEPHLTAQRQRHHRPA